MPHLNEELITAWMHLTAVMEKRELVRGLSFNEALVCNLLDQGCCTASSLCGKTHILKSQMNAILRSLEEKQIITRSPDPADRRRIVLQFLPEGYQFYQASHRHTLRLVDQLILDLGEENARVLVPLLNQAANKFDELLSMEEP